MARPRRPQEEVIGQDSFLDIVANLVGIMIILVMVVGARAKDAITMAESAKAAPAAEESTGLERELASARLATDQLEKDFQRIEQQWRQQKLETAYREAERDRAQLLVMSAEQALAERKEQLDSQQRSALDQQAEMDRAERDLEAFRRRIAQLESAVPETAILDHLPTPLAKTVFGQELHLRLRGGRICYVPWDEFVARLKQDAQMKASRLRDQSEYTDTIGPVGGFWMRYTLKKETKTLAGQGGVALQQTVSLDRFVLLAETEDLGEPLQESLGTGSELATILSRYRPSATTVTVWVYPDSFGDFRQLKHALLERGFVSAARPLPEDHPIGGSPDGTRSAAQ